MDARSGSVTDLEPALNKGRPLNNGFVIHRAVSRSSSSFCSTLTDMMSYRPTNTVVRYNFQGELVL